MECTLVTFEKPDFFVLIPKLEINISTHCIAESFFCNHIKEQCSKFEGNLLQSVEYVLMCMYLKLIKRR